MKFSNNPILKNKIKNKIIQLKKIKKNKTSMNLD